jgi:hypothetical protein
VLMALASLGAMLATSLVTRRIKSRMRRAEQELAYLAYTDTVTDLANRRRTYEVLEAAIAGHAAGGMPPACCCSTSTTSRSSTTPPATPPATACCARWPACCAPRSAPATISAASAATSSR